MAIVYFDTSALVKLLIDEDASRTAVRIWNAADVRAVGTIGHVEVMSALAAARRAGRLDDRTFAGAVRTWRRFRVVAELIPPIARIVVRAGVLADRHALRAFDAVHLASAIAYGSDAIAVWDERLRRGASDAGLAVLP